MAWLWGDSCYGYGSAAEAQTSGKYTSAAQGYQPTGGRFGGPAILVNTTGNGVQLSANYPTLIVGRAHNFAQVSNINPFLRLSDAGGAQLNVRLTLTGGIEVLRGTTVLATSGNGLVVTGRWYWVELRATIHPTAGSFDVWLDGTLVAWASGSNTGVNTRATANSYANQVVWAATGGTDVVETAYILDDTGAAPHNARLGDVRGDRKLPTGAGSSTQFTPSAGANWAAVDDPGAHDGDATYVESNAIGDVDGYALGPALPTATGTVFCVGVVAWCRKTDANSRSMRARIKTAAGTLLGAAFNLSTTYFGVSTYFPADPGGAAWTAATVDDAATEAQIEAVS